MDVEHLWFSSKVQPSSSPCPSRSLDADNNVASASASASAASAAASATTDNGNGLGEEDADNNNPDGQQNLTVMADRRLYKLVKWCKSLPLFKNILVTNTPSSKEYFFFLVNLIVGNRGHVF